MYKVCVWCGVHFEAKQARRKYCSHKCYVAFYRVSIDKQEKLLAATLDPSAEFEEDEEWMPKKRFINGQPAPETDLGWNSIARQTIEKLSRRSDVAPPGARAVKAPNHRGQS